MSEYERWLWVSDWCMETGSLLFIWHGTNGIQPVLMPGYTYYWWLDDSASAALHKDAEGAGGSCRDPYVN